MKCNYLSVNCPRYNDGNCDYHAVMGCFGELKTQKLRDNFLDYWLGKFVDFKDGIAIYSRKNIAG